MTNEETLGSHGKHNNHRRKTAGKALHAGGMCQTCAQVMLQISHYCRHQTVLPQHDRGYHRFFQLQSSTFTLSLFLNPQDLRMPSRGLSPQNLHAASFHNCLPTGPITPKMTGTEILQPIRPYAHFATNLLASGETYQSMQPTRSSQQSK